jgi:Protein of unknown function (DUF2917)
MDFQTLIQTHQSLSASALPGTWKLAAGRAITLRPREAGILRVAHGQMWATYDGPHQGSLNDLGDHVIGTGGQLRVRAGQRLVVESWGGQSPAYFSWDPLPVPAQFSAPRLVRVVQPLSDLRLALALGAGAAGRLVAGLAGLAWDVVAGRGRNGLADCAFNADARTCSAHGA